MRPSELSALHIDDLDTRPEGIVITIRRSKTDQDGAGQIVGVVSRRHRLTDPVAGLAAWLAIRPDGPGPAFTRIHPSGMATLEPIGVRTVSRMVQDRAAAENGADIARIAAQTRHRDIGTLIEHYIRPSDALASSTSRDLGL